MNEKLTQFLIDFELLDKEGEASAQLANNQNLSWSKLVFTDSIPNANKQRIPKEEFPNILRTGILMPIKMATGRINEGHEEALPLGVLSHLKDEGNKVLGLAALWATERADDVALLKKMFADKQNPQLSWEVFYTDATKDENGIEDLHGVTVKAITIVGMPAYQGRTPMTAIANQQANTSTNEEDNNVTEDEVKVNIKELEDRVEALLKDITAKDETIKTQETELASLKEYKASIEQKELELQKFAAIKKQFKDAGIEKDEAYFDTNKEHLMKLDEASLTFMLQEVIAFSTIKPPGTAESSVQVPPIIAPKSGKVTDAKSIADALLKRNLTK